jgi:hypothetical protein
MPAKLTDDLSWPLERAEAWLTESLTSALLAEGGRAQQPGRRLIR